MASCDFSWRVIIMLWIKENHTDKPAKLIVMNIPLGQIYNYII